MEQTSKRRFPLVVATVDLALRVENATPEGGLEPLFRVDIEIIASLRNHASLAAAFFEGAMASSASKPLAVFEAQDALFRNCLEWPGSLGVAQLEGTELTELQLSF